MKKVIECKQITCTYFETHLNVERKNQMVNPTYVDFSIYPYCNLRCDFCYAEAECESTISNHLLKVSDFEDIFEQFDQIGILRVGFEGGEPFYGRIGSKSSNWQISTILITLSIQMQQ